MGTITDRLFGRTKKKEEVHTATTTREWDKEYTAEEVHAELTSKFLLFMEDIKRTTEYNTVPESVRQEYETLEKLGFINSKNAELTGRIVRYVNDFNKKHEENIEALRFMKKAWETFGRDVMVVRYDHFFDLIKKYNLVCGTFDRYTGAIPLDSLAEIARVKKIVDGGHELIIAHHYINRIDISCYSPKEISRFGMIPNDFGILRLMPKPFSQMKLSRENNDDMIGVYHYDSQLYLSGVHFLDYVPHHLFIAAPAYEMKEADIQVVFNSKQGTRQRRADTLVRARVRTYDPFICSLTKYGVMIFTKWGNEAQDDIIKRYEALSKYVNG